MKKVKKLYDWRLILVTVFLITVSILFTFAGGYKFFVNGTLISTNHGTPKVINGVTYVPLKASVHMGDKYYYISKSKSAYITKKSGEKISVTANSYTAKIGSNKYVPYTSKKVNGKYVHKALLISNTMYVPTEFVQKTLKYTVTIKKSGSTTSVYVGKMPASKPAPNSSGAVNREAVINMLSSQYEYAKLTKTSASLNIWNPADTSGYDSLVNLNDPSNMRIVLNGWTTPGVPEGDQVAPSIKKTLQMIIPSGYNNVYNIVDTTAKTGKSSGLNKTFIYNGYKVKVVFPKSYITIYISK